MRTVAQTQGSLSLSWMLQHSSTESKLQEVGSLTCSTKVQMNSLGPWDINTAPCNRLCSS